MGRLAAAGRKVLRLRSRTRSAQDDRVFVSRFFPRFILHPSSFILSVKFSALIANPGEWLRADGPHHDIVISSRVRLARNLRDLPFPGWAKKADRIAILEQLKPQVEALPEMDDAFTEYLQDLSALEKQVLVERHLISREHAARGVGSAVVMNRQQTVSIMINEEDHLRMQAIRCGFQLKNAYKLINKVDSALEDSLDFAYNDALGYLTACPTNVGTGMRASAMLHLPALVLDENINQVIQAVNKIGLAVRGLYGEGTEAMGNLFQVSNQTTLGEKEEDIINRLGKVIEQVIEHEQTARENAPAEQAHDTDRSDRPGVRDFVSRVFDEQQGSAQFPVVYPAGGGPRVFPGRIPAPGGRVVHGNAARAFAKEQPAKAQRGGARRVARGDRAQQAQDVPRAGHDRERASRQGRAEGGVTFPFLSS